MKRKIFIITLLMMLFAVQVYAQRERPGGRNGYRTEHRGNHRPGYSPERGGNRHSDRRGAPQRDYRPAPPQHNGYGYRPERGYHHPRHTPPPRYHYPAPPPPPRFSHHHNYYHHRYHCYFDNWYWYTWGGYRNRFICHRNYHNRYFDSMLGYYLWGTLNAPTRLDIGDMSLTRYNNMLKIQIGTDCSYLDLYQGQTVIYKSGHTTISVSTGNGYASIRFYDEYGNEATYSL